MTKFHLDLKRCQKMFVPIHFPSSSKFVYHCVLATELSLYQNQKPDVVLDIDSAEFIVFGQKQNVCGLSLAVALAPAHSSLTELPKTISVSFEIQGPDKICIGDTIQYLPLGVSWRVIDPAIACVS